MSGTAVPGHGTTDNNRILTDAMGNYPCICGQWWDADGDNPSWDQHMAEVALDALAAAGYLTTPETEEDTPDAR